MRGRRGPIHAMLMLAAWGLCGGGSAAGAELNGLSLFAGRLTDNGWESFFISPRQTSFLNSHILAVVPSWTLLDREPRWLLEGEAQVVRHFGGQSHWEFNGALVFRWRSFPWRSRARTTAAFGIGPSWASRTPRLEARFNRHGSERFLTYWFMEITHSPAAWGPWAATLRLHHRSDAFGLVAEDGGSNIPALGVRRRF
ncbi:hypothetical protein [Thiohalorhabdus methylotrophus]|uniref:Acyloxyacyl hydrolase n=1 Tax=Thiohalorhabdus methylotrophus TaxID=3242694 RepID=A0ABV4TSQ0_9GAMM